MANNIGREGAVTWMPRSYMCIDNTITQHLFSFLQKWSWNVLGMKSKCFEPGNRSTQ
jgi:hypothetical protein